MSSQQITVRMPTDKVEALDKAATKIDEERIKSCKTTRSAKKQAKNKTTRTDIVLDSIDLYLQFDNIATEEGISIQEAINRVFSAYQSQQNSQALETDANINNNNQLGSLAQDSLLMAQRIDSLSIDNQVKILKIIQQTEYEEAAVKKEKYMLLHGANQSDPLGNALLTTHEQSKTEQSDPLVQALIKSCDNQEKY